MDPAAKQEQAGKGEHTELRNAAEMTRGKKRHVQPGNNKKHQ